MYIGQKIAVMKPRVWSSALSSSKTFPGLALCHKNFQVWV